MTTVATSSTTGFSTKFFLTWLMALTIAGIIAGVLENTLWQFGTTIVLEGILIGTAQAIVLAGRIRRPWLWASMTGFLFIPARLLTGPITSLSSDILVDLFGVRFSFWLNSTAMALLVALVAFGIWALYEELSSVWIALNLIGGFLVGVVSAALCLWLCQALTESVGVWLAGAISVGGGWLAYALVTGLWLSSGDRFAPPIEATGDEVFA